jgi:hypothetical protein
MTQEELVAALYAFDEETFKSLDTVTLSRWERDNTKPNTPKQLAIIKYFQDYTGEALSCWHEYSVEEVEDLICSVGVKNLFSKSKELILNFPSSMMQVDDLKVYPIQDIKKAHPLFELNMDLHLSHNHQFSELTIEKFEAWARQPSSLFLACEYKESFVGLFFSIKLKTEVFDKVMNFEMKYSEIEQSDFASQDELGSDLLLSFYAINQEVAKMLFVRHFAYLIANQKILLDIGVTTRTDEVKKIVTNMNLGLFKEIKIKDIRADKEIVVESYRESLHKVLATEYVTKMIFSE